MNVSTATKGFQPDGGYLLIEDPPAYPASKLNLSQLSRLIKYDESQPRDDHGRWTEDGLSGIVDRLASAHNEGDGFTLEMGGKDVEHGIAVGAFPSRSGVFDVQKVTHEDIRGWLVRNRAMLDDQRIRIGAWVDKGKLWLDLVRVYSQQDRDLAQRVGSRKNQIAIADLDAIHRGDWDHAFINTGGTGTAKLLKATGKARWILLPASATAEEILAAVKGK